MGQFYLWEEQSDKTASAQRIVDWLNGKESEVPVPEGVIGGSVSNIVGPSPEISIYFDDGTVRGFYTGTDFYGSYPNDDDIVVTGDTNQKNKCNTTSTLESPNTKESANTKSVFFKPDDILILSPFEWQIGGLQSVSTNAMVNDLKQQGFNPYSRVTNLSDLLYSFCDTWEKEEEGKKTIVRLHHLQTLHPENITTPLDCENLGNYGFVYIYCHSSMWGLDPAMFIRDSNDRNKPIKKIQDFMDKYKEDEITKDNPNGLWRIDWLPIKDIDRYFPGTALSKTGEEVKVNDLIEAIGITREFFKRQNDKPATNFADTVIYINGCHSWQLNQECDSGRLQPAFSTAMAFIGNDEYADLGWEKCMGYYFVKYMLTGIVEPAGVDKYVPTEPPTIVEPDQAMHVKQAIQVLTKYGVNPDPGTYTDDAGEILSKSYCAVRPIIPINTDGEQDEIYFPASPIITVDKHEKNSK